MNIENLEVWKKSIALSMQVYNETADFPVEERFGLTSQIRRSAVSIASNIAEGAGRATDKDFMNFLSIARGSALELKTQIIIANGIGILSVSNKQNFIDKNDEVTRMLSGLRNSIQSRPPISQSSNLKAQSPCF